MHYFVSDDVSIMRSFLVWWVGDISLASLLLLLPLSLCHKDTSLHVDEEPSNVFLNVGCPLRGMQLERCCVSSRVSIELLGSFPSNVQSAMTQSYELPSI